MQRPALPAQPTEKKSGFKLTGEEQMNVDELTDEQLDTFEANYRRVNKTEGGKYSLSEILLEKLRRKPTAFGTREVAAKILELARGSDDGLCTYGQIWSEFRPNAPWEGHKTLSIVASSLGRVVHYCVTNDLPILTTLVVQTGTRQLSEKAIQNIYNDCRELGVRVGPDPDAFVRKQVDLARALAISDLPIPATN
ncbi:hypothetical protein XI03_31385 [Bradyrhizobium sp. CCBAU 65884]|nr:hypothetical protein [Bradyrhizobium sp. CCBAU 65884]